MQCIEPPVETNADSMFHVGLRPSFGSSIFTGDKKKKEC